MADTKENPELAHKILGQIEFYFSDSNYPKDKHLKALAAVNNGWVPISEVAAFNRIKQMSTDVAFITNALRQSTHLKVSEDGTKIQRVNPVPETVNIDDRSIYAKGWPSDSTIESIQNYWKDKSKVLSVRLRRNADKSFKGSAFIEFESVEEAKKIVGTEQKLADGSTLIIVYKPDYVAKKKEEAKAEREKKKGKKRGADGGEEQGKTKKQKTENKEGETKEGDAAEGEAKEGEEKKEEKREIIPDLLVSFAKLPAEALREDLKECLIAVGAKVRYVDFSKGQDSGIVRLDEATEVKASAAVKTLVERGLEINNVKPEIKALEGEDEKKVWENIFSRQANSKHKGGNKRGGKRGGRGGRGRGGKRGGRGKKDGSKPAEGANAGGDA